MLKDKLAEIVKEIEPMLSERGFTKRSAANGFIRKNKADHQREEHIDLSARGHQNDPEAIYISCTIGLYYRAVRKIYKGLK